MTMSAILKDLDKNDTIGIFSSHTSFTIACQDI